MEQADQSEPHSGFPLRFTLGFNLGTTLGLLLGLPETELRIKEFIVFAANVYL